MARNYVCSSVDVFQRVDVPLLDFPAGEGPPIYVSAAGGAWVRLGLGQEALVELGGDGGGAFGWGMTTSRVVIWIRRAAGQEGLAYCHHAGCGPLQPASLTRAMEALDCARWNRPELYTIIGSRGAVAPADEAYLLAEGFRSERIFTYSSSLTPQFGVSANGCVGEPI